MSINIRPVSANLQNDTDTFSKADPYVILIVGKQKKQGKQAKNGGKKPTWNQNFTFNNTKDTLVSIQVWDKDTFSADDLMGTCQYDVSKLFSTPNNTKKEFIELKVKDKVTGQIIVQFTYNAPQIPAQPQGGQGQQQWQPNNQPNQPYVPNQGQGGQQFPPWVNGPSGGSKGWQGQANWGQQFNQGQQPPQQQYNQGQNTQPNQPNQQNQNQQGGSGGFFL